MEMNVLIRADVRFEVKSVNYIFFLLFSVIIVSVAPEYLHFGR